MSAERDRAAGALHDFQAVCADVRRILGQSETTAAHVGRQLERGSPLLGTMHDNHVATRRRELTDMLAELEAARRRMRVACIRLGLQQGASLGELARAWGISHQLVSRLAHETDGPPTRHPAPS